MFFLEVKAFDDEFVAAQSQAMAAGRAGARRAGPGRGAEGNRRRHLEARRPRRARPQRRSRLPTCAPWPPRSGRSNSARPRRPAASCRDRPAAIRGAAVAAPPPTRSATTRWAWPSRRCGARPWSSKRCSTEAAMPHELEALNQLLRAETDVQAATGGAPAERRRWRRQSQHARLVVALRSGAAQAAADQLRDAGGVGDPAGRAHRG